MSSRPLLLCLVAVTSCSVGLDVPAGATITCASDSDCPAPRVCAVDLGLCLTAGENQERPRVVGAAVVTPTLVGASATATITFSVNKDLAVDPDVVFTWAGATPVQEAAAKVSLDPASHAYVFNFAKDSATPEGIATLTITVRDSHGDTGIYTHADPITFDFTPPTIVPVAVGYQAAAGALISGVTAGAVGGVISVQFTSSEALADSTTVTAAAGTLAFTAAVKLPPLYAYEATVSGSTPEGASDITVVAADLAGNSVTQSVGSAVVDRTPPAVADIVTAGRVLFDRIPWGSGDPAAPAAARQQPYFAVSGTAQSVEAGGLVQLLDGSGASSDVLASGIADGSGAFGPLVLNGDYPNVWIRVVDPAGNPSIIAGVKEGTWTATLNGSRPDGAILFNPNVAHNLPSAAAERVPVYTEALSSAQVQLMAESGDGVNVATSKRSWTQQNSTTPTARFFQASAFDPVRNTLLFFGGTSGTDLTTRLGDTWTWNGAQFQQVALGSASPHARWGHAMAYDPVHDNIVLFGGFTSNGGNNETWIWDGSSWVQLVPDGDVPAPRFFQAMTFDPASQSVMMFGGCADNECLGMLGDTWLWDGVSWHDVTPATSPSARAATAMVYHAPLGGVVMHSGCDENNALNLSGSNPYCDHGGNPDADTWVWNGSSWANITTATEPPQRAFYHLVSTASGLLAVGGCTLFDNGTTQGCLPVDEANGGAPVSVMCRGASGWSSSTLSGNDASSAAAGDVINGALITQGGLVDDFGNTGPSAAVQKITATCATSTETDIFPDGALDQPNARRGAVVTYVPLRTSSFVFGGALAESPAVYNWNGLRWFNEQSGGAPSSRYGIGGAYDSGRDRLVMFGGAVGGSAIAITDATYEIATTAFSSWVKVCTTGTCQNSMPPRYYHASATNGSGQMVVFGGAASSSANLSDLWVYNGATPQWSPLCTACARPSTRRCSAMAYDSARNKLVLFGGTTQTNFDCDVQIDPNALADTWEWSFATSSWAHVCTASPCVSPAGRAGHNLIYDAARARTVLMGGSDGDDIWEWDGTTWRQVQSVGAVPPARHLAGATYDATNNVGLLYSGWLESQEDVPDLWLFNLSPHVRPGVGVDFAWSSANVDAADAISLTVTAIAGASGYTLDTTLGGDNDVIGELQAGAALEIWKWTTSTWQRVATNTSDVTGVAALTYSETDPATVRSYIDGSPSTIFARVVTASEAGNGPAAQAAVDYIEAKVGYRKP